MPRQYPAAPLPGVLALVVRDGRVLMVQRAHEPDRGKWGFPGGLIELGETVAAAALRELREETGLSAEAGGIIDVFDVITPDEDGRVRYHFVLNVVVCPGWRAKRSPPTMPRRWAGTASPTSTIPPCPVAAMWAVWPAWCWLNVNASHRHSRLRGNDDGKEVFP